jgi:hypothetical protein
VRLGVGANNKVLVADSAETTGLKWANILDLVYPVGAIYMSVVNTSPATLFGGTWSAWGAGRVPVGIDTGQTEFNTVEKTGGAKTHTLQTTEMPSHSHLFGSTQNSGNAQVITGISGSYTNLPNYDYLGVNQGIASGTDNRLNIKNTGGGGAHNNLQPYITCFMWKRVS